MPEETPESIWDDFLTPTLEMPPEIVSEHYFGAAEDAFRAATAADILGFAWRIDAFDNFESPSSPLMTREYRLTVRQWTHSDVYGSLVDRAKPIQVVTEEHGVRCPSCEEMATATVEDSRIVEIHCEHCDYREERD